MIKVIVFNDISPEFIEPQLISLKKYLREDFEYVLCSGGAQGLSRKPDKAAEVAEVCRQLGVRVIDIDRDPGVVSHCIGTGQPPRTPDMQVFGSDGRFRDNPEATYITQWVWERVVAKEQGYVCFLHSDVFLLEPIRFSDYIDKYPLCSCISRKAQTDLPPNTWPPVPHVPLVNLRHLWEPFMLMDMSRLPEPDTVCWWSGWVKQTWMPDSGMTYYWLDKHPEVDVMEVIPSGSDDDPAVDFHPSRYQFFTVGDKRVLHYMAGCRWATDEWVNGGVLKETPDEYHSKKLAWARKLCGILDSDILLEGVSVPRRDDENDHWRYSIGARSIEGQILEFGVCGGMTINIIAASVNDHKVYGFDSFEGLPERWWCIDKGTFKCPPPAVRHNVELVVGMFEDTLPGFTEAHPEPIALLHMDADLYSSSKTVLRHVANQIVTGTVIMFDEYTDYPGWREHEFKAFQEFVAETGKTFEYISVSRNGAHPTRVTVRMTS